MSSPLGGDGGNPLADSLSVRYEKVGGVGAGRLRVHGIPLVSVIVTVHQRSGI
jgi:hypothetical protein